MTAVERHRDGFAAKRPTVADVARVAGVSNMTVSRVVNGVPTVDPALRQRVVDAIKSTGYRRNEMAHTLRSGRLSSSVGLLIEDISNPFYSAVAAGAADVALDRDVLLFTASSEENARRERTLLLAMCERRVDGLLVVPTNSNHSYLAPEIEMGMKIVFLDREATGLNADSVLIDNTGGTRQAITELLDRGHSRVALLVDSLEIPTMRARLDSARTVLAAAGCSVEPHFVREGLHDPVSAREALVDLLTRPDPPTGVFCGNNRITMGAVEAMLTSGVDVDLVGFDDFEAASLMPRPISVVRFDARDIGRQGAELLFRRIDGDTGGLRRVVIPTNLVSRGTRE